MIDPFIAFVLLAAIVAVSIGSAKLVSWCLDRRGESARRTARESQLVAQSVVDLRRLEIEATKRGNLLAAAELAEEQERAA